MFWFALIFLTCLSPLSRGEDFTRKFEYQHSFKGPQLTIDNQIPFWSHGESALPSEDQIRLVPSIRSKKGFVWSQFPYKSNHFEVEVTFKITGRGRIGADGMAIWFTDSPGFEGNVYGNRDMWTGLGIFLDSYDNDGKGNNPYISIVSNDGTHSYNHALDGGDQVLAGCQYDFRNKPYPTRLKIQYYNERISIWFSAGLGQETEYELCLTHDYKGMPVEKYLGVSAATGGLADDHDVLSFLTYTLIQKVAQKDGGTQPDKEKERLEEEFKKFSDTMEERKKTYREENPNKFQDQVDPEFEDLQERQLRMVLDGQQRLFRSLNEIKRKLDGGSPSSPGSPDVDPDSLRRLQSGLTSITSSINHIYTVAGEQKTILKEIQQRVTLLQTGGGGSGGNKAQPSAALDNALKSDVSIIKQEVLNLKQSVKKLPVECPRVLERSEDSDNDECVSNATFLLVVLLQIVMAAVYIYFQRKKEQSSKKFF